MNRRRRPRGNVGGGIRGTVSQGGRGEIRIPVLRDPAQWRLGEEDMRQRTHRTGLDSELQSRACGKRRGLRAGPQISAMRKYLQWVWFSHLLGETGTRTHGQALACYGFGVRMRPRPDRDLGLSACMIMQAGGILRGTPFSTISGHTKLPGGCIQRGRIAKNASHIDKGAVSLPPCPDSRIRVRGLK